MKKVQRGTSLAFSYGFSILGLMILSPTAMAVSKGLGAKGDSCDIALPGGTKEPGTEDGNGNCCSILHTDKCVVILKPFPGAGAALATKGVKGAQIIAPTATPALRRAVPLATKAKVVAVTPTPTPTPK